MTLQQHILAALQEQMEEWDEYLSALTPEQIQTPIKESDWTVKDVVAHLAAWQELSNARLEAALSGREPLPPDWMSGIDPDREESTDEINARIYARYQALTWAEVHTRWLNGYRHLIETATLIDEPTLLDGDRTPWLHGYSLADVLIGTYDHHREHEIKLFS